MEAPKSQLSHASDTPKLEFCHFEGKRISAELFCVNQVLISASFFLAWALPSSPPFASLLVASCQFYLAEGSHVAERVRATPEGCTLLYGTTNYS